MERREKGRMKGEKGEKGRTTKERKREREGGCRKERRKNKNNLQKE